MRFIRLVGIWAAVVLLLLVSGEVIARYGLGLGDPPLLITHPEVEYLFKPGQDVKRFGNRIQINAYGMRSPNINEIKDEDEFRVLVFGDSVLHGGNLTHQPDLATEQLKDRLGQAINGNIVVGNVSAGSWGPGNWLGYARSFGFFDADVVMLLISTHDHRDNPTFKSLNPIRHPQSRPVSALWEGMTRYLPRYVPLFRIDGPDNKDADDVHPSAAAAIGLEDLRKFLLKAQQITAHVIVVQFLDRAELKTQPGEGYYLIRNVALDVGAPVVTTEEYFRDALESGIQPYRDNIHINAEGQSLLAEVFWQALLEQPGLLPPSEYKPNRYKTIP